MSSIHPSWQRSAEEIVERATRGPRALQIQASDAAANGGPADITALSPMRRMVVRLVAEGLGNTQIAARLGISQQTVKNHLTLAYRDLGLSAHDGNPRVHIAYAVGRCDGAADARGRPS